MTSRSLKQGDVVQASTPRAVPGTQTSPEQQKEVSNGNSNHELYKR